jgi:uncharacterized iron-regulated membrane protein
MGKEGRAVNGLVAIGFTGLILSGLIVWWPGLVNWKRGLTLNAKLSWKRINYDLHNVAGIASIVFLILMAGTAVCLAAKDIPGLLAFGKSSEASKGLGAGKGSAASKGSEASHEGKRHGGGKEHRHVAATSEGRAAKPIDELVGLASLDPSLSRFQLSGLELRDKHGEGAQLLYEGPGGAVTVRVDSASGKILSKTEPGRFGMDPDAHNTIEAIHFGRWGGLASRVFWVLLGLTPGLLALTGLIMWWNRSLSKKLSGVKGTWAVAGRS